MIKKGTRGGRYEIVPKARPIKILGTVIEPEKFEKISQAFKDKNIELKIENGCPLDDARIL